VADIVVKTAQDILAAIDHRDVGAVAGENAGEFERDIAAALDHDALRQFLQVKRLVRRNHMLECRDGLPVIGRAAGRDQHNFRRDGLCHREAKRVGIFEHRAARGHLDRPMSRRPAGTWSRPARCSKMPTRFASRCKTVTAKVVLIATGGAPNHGQGHPGIEQ